MIDRVQSGRSGYRICSRLEPWILSLEVDERVERLSVGLDRPNHHPTEIVLDDYRLHVRLCTTLDRLLECDERVGHKKRNISYTRSMCPDVLRDLVVRALGASNDELDLIRPQQIGGAITHTGLRSRIANNLEPKKRPISLGDQEGISHPPLDGTEPLHRERILRGKLLGAQCQISIHDPPL